MGVKTRVHRWRLFLGRALGVEMGVELARREAGIDAARGNLKFGHPRERVQDSLAKLIVAPVVMEMTAGEPKAAASVGTFHGPEHCLGAPARSLNMGVRPLGVNIGPTADVVSGLGDKNRDEFGAPALCRAV